MPDDNKKRLLQLARRHGLTIIEDDVFGELYFGSQHPGPLKAWDRDGDVIYCSSFTKSCPAFRLGWLSGGRHHAALERLRESSSPGQPGHLLAVLSRCWPAATTPASASASASS
jgi:DNA-binding transcriptional MocR family regulator